MSLMLQWIALLKQSDGLQRHDQAVSRGARQYVERMVNLGKVRHTKRGELDPNHEGDTDDCRSNHPLWPFWQNEAKFINKIKQSGGAYALRCGERQRAATALARKMAVVLHANHSNQHSAPQRHKSSSELTVFVHS